MDNMFDTLDPSIVNHVDEERDYLQELVGDDKKFKDVKALAKGKAYSDAAIEVLKRKVDELQSELTGKMNLEAFITEMKKTREIPDPTPPVLTPDTSVQFNAQDLDNKFEEYIQKREARVKAETNLEKVTRVMEQNFGPDAKLVVNKKAKDLGMSLQDLQNLALRSPQAFFSLVGASEQAQRSAPSFPQPGLNTSNQSTQGLRGKKFYEKMKRDDPKLYNKPETTIQMMKDAAAWGSIEAFNAN